MKVAEAKKGFVSVRLSADRALMSHLGTYQAGSLFTLAEVTGGLAVGTFVDLSKNLLLARGGKIDFREGVGEDLLSEARVEEEDIAKALSGLSGRKKTDVSIAVALRTVSGKVVAESEFKYYVRLGIPRSLVSQG
jgi:acyl-coenzyme A thioesterase PaaI-like protein